MADVTNLSLTCQYTVCYNVYVKFYIAYAGCRFFGNGALIYAQEMEDSFVNVRCSFTKGI